MNAVLNPAPSALPLQINADVLAELRANEETFVTGDTLTDADIDQHKVARAPMTAADFAARAARQRAAGKANLQKRSDATASMMVDIGLCERSGASLLLRYLYGIDGTLFQVNKYGARLIAADQINAIRQGVAARTEEARILLETVTAEFSGRIASLGDNAIFPVYSGLAYEGQLQMRTPASWKIASLFQQFDHILVLREQLTWNDLASDDDGKSIETAFREIIRGISADLRAINTNMRNAASTQIAAAAYPNRGAALFQAKPVTQSSAVS